MVKKSPRLKRQLPAVVGGMKVPKSDQHRAFCEAWLKHYDHNRAAREAGYSAHNVNAGVGKRTFALFAQYLTKQKEIKEKALVKELALDQKDILAEMMAIGFANALDYVKEVEEEEKDMETGEVRMVRRHRQKLVTELTRAQAAAISKVTFLPDGTVTYDIPDERSKHPYLKDLGQHLGLFHPKLIQEHRHEHRHRAISFRDMDMEKLAKAEKMLIDALGPEGRRMLGLQDFQEAEFEDVTGK